MCLHLLKMLQIYMIKVYKAEWYLNGKLIANAESGREFFSREKAIENAECRKPEPGVDYPQKDVLQVRNG